MSAQAIQDEILDPMQRLFIAPKQLSSEQQTMALRDYADALRGFEREDLKAAWKTVRDNAQARSWPPIANFVKAAVLAKRERQQEKAAKDPARTAPLHRFDMDGWRAHFYENWKYLRHQPIARAAAREGWALMLKSVVLDGLPLGRIEPSVFISRCKRAARLAEIVEADLEFPERSKALDMWHNMKVQRAEVEDEIARVYGPGPPMPLVPGFVYPFRLQSLDEPPAKHLDRAYGPQEMLA